VATKKSAPVSSDTKGGVCELLAAIRGDRVDQPETNQGSLIIAERTASAGLHPPVRYLHSINGRASSPIRPLICSGLKLSPGFPSITA